MPSLALALVVFLLAPATAQARSWLRPLDGTVLRAFALGADPYARGWHRGIDLAASAGARVRSACAGRVMFAGRVPRGGSTVSVRCGGLVATYQQLGTIAVRAGGRLDAGASIGTVGRSSDPRTPRAHLHLGARDAVTGRYVDPLSLLRGAPPAAPLITRRPPRVPLGPAPLATTPRVAPRVPAALPAPAPAGVPQGAPEGRSPPARPAVAWPVWVGLVSMALAVPLGGLVSVTRSRRRCRAAPGAVAAAR